MENQVMKLLLTSAGLQNKTLADALGQLVGKAPGGTKIGFVPTAANVEHGNKDWFVRQITNLYTHGYTWVDVVDISAHGVGWKQRLAEVDVILVGGGNTFHLLDQVRKTGFGDWLTTALTSKVYMGISAGSILVTPSIAIASVDNGDVNVPGITDLRGLSFVPFEVSPHTPESVSHEGNKVYKATIENELYAFDDQSAVAVNGDVVEVVSEGAWVKY